MGFGLLSGYYYYIILLLQGFCLFHAYKNRIEQKWYWIIIFVPLLGASIYIYMNILKDLNKDDIIEQTKNITNTNYKLQKLEKVNRFAETPENKIKLAEEYMHKGRAREAIQLLESCLSGIHQADPGLQTRLMKACYMDKQYPRVIELGNLLKEEKTFSNAEERIAYAWALFYTGQTEKAYLEFSSMNKTYRNYKHRCEFVKFLIETNNPESKHVFHELSQELNAMEGYERKLNRDVINEVKRLKI